MPPGEVSAKSSAVPKVKAASAKAAAAKGKGGGKSKGTGRTAGKGPGQRPLQPPDRLDWEDDNLPNVLNRPDIVESIANSASYAQARARVKRTHEARVEDPAMLDREWKINISLTGITNSTASDWEVFIALSTREQSRLGEHRLHDKFSYTQSYIVPHNNFKTLSPAELVLNKTSQYSYRELKRTDVVFDVWIAKKNNFNQILGTGHKSLYDFANETAFQQIFIKPNQHTVRTAYDIGSLHVTAVVSETVRFTLKASNWQFAPSVPSDTTEPKALRISMPKDEHGAVDTFQTRTEPGPRYIWAAAGEYKYVGTKTSLQFDAMEVVLISGGRKQGSAKVSLGVAGDYPIASGTIKNVEGGAAKYVKGKIAGNLAVTSTSKLFANDVVDENPSIPKPVQPLTSLMMFHLNPNQMYLVVELGSADNLPIADPDSASTNPFCRVKFDGMAQQSPILENTVAPTWGHTFYIPVRWPDNRIYRNPTLLKTIMPIEMESKGFLELEVWHMDTVPTEFLGSYKLDLHQLRFSDVNRKAICDKVVSAKKPETAGRDVEDVDDIGIHPVFRKKHRTHVFEGRRVKLTGSLLPSINQATLTFSAYFIPDFPDKFVYRPQQDFEKTLMEKFKDSLNAWPGMWPKFEDAYTTWFPDAPKNRRFLHAYKKNGDDFPLPLLISALAVPSSLGTHQAIRHWIKCFEFSIPPRQRSNALINTWQQPAEVLALRRGSVQDHAVLLCGALLGVGKSAFVCKGTVQQGKEHAWVMTREKEGTVTFWETTTGAQYHLALRWNGETANSDRAKKRVQDRWTGRPGGIQWRDPAALQARKEFLRTDQLEKMKDLTKLDISPWKELYSEDNLVVVPYESIEVVFNNAQLWGNLGNHHPACIYYDMEYDPKSWKPCIAEDARHHLLAGKSVAIPVGPTITSYAADALRDNIEGEVKESIRMIRMRQGYDSYFENDPFKREYLENYLQFLERECLLDADWAFDKEGKQKQPWAKGSKSPFDAMTHVQDCKKKWKEYWNQREATIADMTHMVVKENHVFSAVPLHFSTNDVKEIRRSLLVSKAVQQYVMLDTDGATFCAYVHVHPLPSNVASVWLFLGAEFPLPDDKIQELFQAKSDALLHAEESEDDELDM